MDYMAGATDRQRALGSNDDEGLSADGCAENKK
jgi:hypothetical protein